MLGEMRTDTLTVYLTIDVGPADAVLGRGTDIDADWTPTMRGTELLFDALEQTADELGEPVGTTWFLRADRLIEAQFGGRLAILERFGELVQTRRALPVETGWMPQIYGSGSASIDYDDLDATHALLVAAGRAPRSVRMGNCYHDNGTMAALDSLGVALDSSAMPGRTKIEGAWMLDWSSTPDLIFRPSRADYRQPGTPALNILEVPLTMMPIKADYDDVPLSRYVNPAMRAELVWPGLAQLVASREHVVLIVHPDEVYPVRHTAAHPLIGYSVQTFLDNLSRLVRESKRIDRNIRFMSLGEIVAPMVEPGA